MYYLLTERFKSQEAKLVSLIRETVPVEKIYLLGSSLQQQRTESVFVTDAPSRRHAGHYWLLVLVDPDTSPGSNYVQDKIENTCRQLVPVTAIVLGQPQFNTWLNEGHRFACTVAGIAVLLYNSSTIPPVIPSAVREDIMADQSFYTQSLNRVNEFIAGADLYRLRQQNKMAAFMLHQAAEQGLLALFKKATGLHVSTHNIDKLVRYCSMVYDRIPLLFGPENGGGGQPLKLLQKAYVEARYKEDFAVNNADMVGITRGVKLLQAMVQEGIESEAGEVVHGS